MQHAVDAQANAKMLPKGLEVDIRGAALDGQTQRLVDELHHRRIAVVGVGDVGGVFFGCQRRRQRFVALVQCLLQPGRRPMFQMDALAGGETQRRQQPAALR